jgi:hypothetical protein
MALSGQTSLARFLSAIGATADKGWQIRGYENQGQLVLKGKQKGVSVSRLPHADGL